MSLLPLTRINVVDSKDEQSENILIMGIDWNQIDDDKTSNVCYDLRLGEQYRDHRDNSAKQLEENGKISITSGTAMIVETLESISLPSTIFGSVYPKVSLSQKGLANLTSKVDPGYEGKLLITIFNLGKKTIELEYKKAFCSIVFQEVNPAASLYSKGGKNIEATVAQNKFRTTRDFINSHYGEIAIIISIIAIIVSAFK